MHKTGLKAIMIYHWIVNVEGFYISKQVIDKEGKLPNNFAWTCVTGQQISFIFQHMLLRKPWIDIDLHKFYHIFQKLNSPLTTQHIVIADFYRIWNLYFHMPCCRYFILQQET